MGKRGIESLDLEDTGSPLPPVKPERLVAEILEPKVKKIEVIEGSPSPPPRPSLLPPRSKKVPRFTPIVPTRTPPPPVLA